MPWFPLVVKIGHWGSSAPAPLASGGCQSVFLQPRQQLTTPSRHKSPQTRRPGNQVHWLLGLRRLGAQTWGPTPASAAGAQRNSAWSSRAQAPPTEVCAPSGQFYEKSSVSIHTVTELSGDAGTDPPGPVGFMGNGLARPRDTAGQAGLYWRPKAMSLGPVLTALPCTPAAPQPRSRGANSALRPSWPLGPLAGLCTWPHRAQSGWTAPARADVAARPSVWSGQASNTACVSSLHVWDEHDPLQGLTWRGAVIPAAFLVAPRGSADLLLSWWQFAKGPAAVCPTGRVWGLFRLVLPVHSI